MSAGEDSNPSLIVPPPGILPVPDPDPEAVAGEPAPAEALIGLPPGLVGPAALRVQASRPPRPESAVADDIVFFPVVPGVPVPSAAAAESPEETLVGLPRHAAAGWRIVLPDGESVDVVGSVFLGRDPVRAAGWPDAELRAVNDPTTSLSKTHALLEVDGGLLWVHDLDSTNGVFIVEAGREAVEVVPGRRALVPAGAELEFGEYVVAVLHG